MKTLRSHLAGEWRTPSGGFRELHDPVTEEPIARAGETPFDLSLALGYARRVGGAELRSLTFAGRGGILAAMSAALVEARDELLDLSVQTTGVTRRDAKFDVDGATGTLSYYAHLAKSLGEERVLHDGPGDALGRSARFWGQHVWIPRHGVAVLVNAFNFPAWGFAEKAACAILAGVPVLAKPATSTAWVAERCTEILVDSGAVPPGVFSFLAGPAGDLLDHLGPQDVLAFTGSAATGLALRRREGLLARSVRVNVEADSLNAAVLGPDVAAGSETYALFLREVVREVTQKSGQKCTAVRRILVPADRVQEIGLEIGARLGEVVTGDPRDEKVTMGPLTTADQLDQAIAGVAALREAGARLVHGTGGRIDGRGAEPGRGWFFGPTLLAVDGSSAAPIVHEREVFGPVATLVPYEGAAETAAQIVARGGGSLVTSIYSDDEDWVARILPGAAAWNGRVYLGSAKMAEQAPGSGLVLAASKHGGPGRAGGGEELGGLRGLQTFLHRVAVQGSKTMIERLVGRPGE